MQTAGSHPSPGSRWVAVDGYQAKPLGDEVTRRELLARIDQAICPSAMFPLKHQEYVDRRVGRS